MSEFDGMTDRESVLHQVKRWAGGVALHNTIRDECCPDFSCCNGGKMMTEDCRKRFLAAYTEGDEETTQGMAIMGLSGMVADLAVDVYIVDGENKIDH